MLCTKQQMLNGLAIVGRALHRLVGVRTNRLQHGSFGLAHGTHHRQLASIVEIDADAEVDLLWPRVAAESLVEAEDWIARVGVNMGEHKGSWSKASLSERFFCARLSRKVARRGQAAAKAASMSGVIDSGESLGA